MTDTVAASKKRRLVAMHLDLFFFLAVYRLLGYALSGGNPPPLWPALIAFIPVRIAARRLIGSPGLRILSIDRNGHVDPGILHRENWLTFVLGMLLVFDGTKQLTRWTQMDAPQPFFGILPGETPSVVIALVGGALFLLAGWGLLRLNRAGFWLAIALMAATVVSCVLSASLWNEAMAEIVAERRALRGQAFGEGEVRFMRMLMPELMVAAAAVLLAATASTYRRFAGHPQPAPQLGGD